MIALLGAGLALGAGVAGEKKVVCYFSGWAFYRPGSGRFDIDNIDPFLCTHINYAFANMDNSTWELVSYDPWYDLAPWDQGCDGDHCHWDSYRRFNKLKEVNPDLKTLISVGGWNSGSGQWSQMASDPMKRDIFIKSSVSFVARFGFDGIDFDWEYPGSRPGSDLEHDKESFTVFIQEYAEALHQEGFILTAATSPNINIAEAGYDFPKVMEALDFANIMVYDYHGTWENFTGHETPLYGRVEENNPDHPGYLFNVNATINYYLESGAPAEKLVLGTAGYGRGFIVDSSTNTGLYCPTAGPIPKAEFTRSDGFWSYYEILQSQKGNTNIRIISHRLILKECKV